MQALITGYDVTAEYGRQLVAEYATARGELPVDEPDLLHGELALLTTFADLSELSRNRPTSAEEEADEQVHSRASTSTPTCTRWTSTSRVCRRASAPG